MNRTLLILSYDNGDEDAFIHYNNTQESIETMVQEEIEFDRDVHIPGENKLLKIEAFIFNEADKLPKFTLIKKVDL